MNILLRVTRRFKFLVLSRSPAKFSSTRLNERSLKTQPLPDRYTLGYRPTLLCIVLYFMLYEKDCMYLTIFKLSINPRKTKRNTLPRLQVSYALSQQDNFRRVCLACVFVV